MDNITALITAHSNATKLENEIQKVRGNLIKAYLNDTSQDLYLLKINYAGLAAQLTKEASIFNKILKDLEKNESIINDNTTSDITENIDCESSVQPEVNESYDNNSVLSVTTPHNTIQLQHTDSTSIPETKETVENIQSLPVPNSTQQIEQNTATNNTKTIKHYTSTSGQWIKKTGYKYTGKGFEVFTGWKNKCKPIYSSTLLYCYETCDGNKQALKNYLIKYGKFKEDMITDIIFKTNYSKRYRYALIKVKQPLNYIKKKMIVLNKAARSQLAAENKYYETDVISLFKGRRIISDTEWIHMNNVLYVNGFDIVNINTHKKFTNLFLRYGELENDIIMGVDSYGEPYAIVYFKELDDAKKCFELELTFGGKVLNIRFYKN